MAVLRKVKLGEAISQLSTKTLLLGAICSKVPQQDGTSGVVSLKNSPKEDFMLRGQGIVGEVCPLELLFRGLSPTYHQ